MSIAVSVNVLAAVVKKNRVNLDASLYNLFADPLREEAHQASLCGQRR